MEFCWFSILHQVYTDLMDFLAACIPCCTWSWHLSRGKWSLTLDQQIHYPVHRVPGSELEKTRVVIIQCNSLRIVFMSDQVTIGYCSLLYRVYIIDVCTGYIRVLQRSISDWHLQYERIYTHIKHTLASWSLIKNPFIIFPAFVFWLSDQNISWLFAWECNDVFEVVELLLRVDESIGGRCTVWTFDWKETVMLAVWSWDCSAALSICWYAWAHDLRSTNTNGQFLCKPSHLFPVIQRALYNWTKNVYFWKLQKGGTVSQTSVTGPLSRRNEWFKTRV